MSEMLEKMAMAIGAKWIDAPEGHPLFVELWPDHRQDALEAAKAALRAIREPSPEAVEAGCRNPDIDGRPLWKRTVDVQCSVRFTAMIDHILQEQES